MVKVGLTGGIGSGKSVVSRILSAMGYDVYDSDRNAGRLMVSCPDVIGKIVGLVGKDAYMPDGSLNKPVIASFIYNDPGNRKALNAIVHPAVFNDFGDWCAGIDRDIVFVESAILFESGLDRFVDRSVMVYAPLEDRVKRVMARDGIDRSQVLGRIGSQMPDGEKLKKCDFVINNGENERLVPQIFSLISTLGAVSNT